MFKFEQSLSFPSLTVGLLSHILLDVGLDVTRRGDKLNLVISSAQIREVIITVRICHGLCQIIAPLPAYPFI